MSRPQQHGDDGEWKHVGRAKGRAKGWTKYDAACKALRQEFAPLMKDASLEMIQKNFDIKLKVWRKSSCRRQLVQFLESKKPDDGWCLENAICLGSHSFSRDNFSNRQRAVMQFVAFHDIVLHLRTLQEAPIVMYAQDPTYTAVDRTWLASVDVTPTDLDLENLPKTGLGPAKDLLRSTSLVFELFMEVRTEAAFELFGSDLSLYVGSCCDHFIERGSDKLSALRQSIRDDRRRTEGLKKRDKDDDWTQDWDIPTDIATFFQQTHRKLDFPTFQEDPNIFEGLKMYWKEPSDEDYWS